MNVLKVVCVVGLASLATHATAATMTLNPTHDATVWNRDTNAAYTDANFGSSTELEIYHFDDNLNAYSYLQFDLSGIGAGQMITAANLNLTKVQNVSDGITGSDRNDTLVDARIAIYGLLDVAGNTPQNWDEAVLTAGNSGDELAGGTSDTETNLFDPPTRSINFDTQEVVTANTTVDLSSTDFVNFLNSRAGSTVTLMLDNPDSTGGRGMAFGSSESTVASPVLTLTVVPEPAGLALLCLCGLSLAGRRRG